jgi:pyruvate,water dikinase
VALASAPVLIKGRGEVAQRGIAAGRVHQVQEADDPDDFPLGAIAVTRYASPRLAPIMRKAAAIVSDMGSSTGHMATIAREFGVPMIVNTTDATTVLPEGTEVTVDAEEAVVYGAIIEELLTYGAEAEDVYRDLKEYRVLRQLIRKISPLSLVDPNSADFTPKNCKTYHDIVRFSHEKAVKLLIDLNVSSRRFRGVKSKELKLDIPLGLRIIDMGGGLESGQEAKRIDSIDQVRCHPLNALLRGLSAPGTWSTQPMNLGFGDLISSLTRYSMADRGAQYQGQNLAVVTEDYVNLSLRLGYHFNVIDAYVSDSPDDNYIYFRFVGGVTENERRHLRAILLSKILYKLKFAVRVNGDLVVARLKKQGQQELIAVLNEIGRLIGFTRQLDTQMVSEESVAEGVRAFFEPR